jgi:glutamyl-Q tRNA(Asp) synthetase
MGSLYAAVASYLDARAHGGRWLLRIEDLDKPREVRGSADSILRTLDAFGFEWDGEIVRQSTRLEAYRSALDFLSQSGLTFGCSCSRAQLENDARYPGTCRGVSAGTAPCATRMRVDAALVTFTDRIQGTFRQDVAAAVGDVIIKRRDQIFSYLLAVVVDDAAQGVTHVVRGADLLDNTPRQIYLQRHLQAPQPSYAHVPVLTDARDAKLAKSRQSVSVTRGGVTAQLLSVFSLLGMQPPPFADAQISEAWTWALRSWDIINVPKCLNVQLQT